MPSKLSTKATPTNGTIYSNHCQLTLDRALKANPQTLNNHWGERHNAALVTPQGPEVGILLMLRGAALTCDAHHSAHGESVGVSCYYTAECIGHILHGLTQLLSTELGRLDGGTLSHAIIELANAAGLDPDKLLG